MRRTLTFRSLTTGALLGCAAASVAHAQPPSPILGRWDLTVQGTDGPYPSWVEVTKSGSKALVGRFVAGGGSARPIARVEFANGIMRFAIPPQWDREDADLKFEATLADDVSTGLITNPSGEKQRFTGKRAPLLRRSTPVAWSAPTPLFNGKDLTGWMPGGGSNEWKAVDGVLQNTTATF